MITRAEVDHILWKVNLLRVHKLSRKELEEELREYLYIDSLEVFFQDDKVVVETPCWSLFIERLNYRIVY